MNEIIIGLLLLIQLEIAIGLLLWYGRFRGGKPVFIDTSVLMDGRIVSIAAAGFVPEKLYIPASVLKELQLVADASDSDKRARARHGLDVAAALRASGAKIFHDTAKTGVDDGLLALANRYKGSICTIDFNLNKVAAAQGITVLNIHELAQTLRTSHLPGEKVSLKITQKGSDSHQGVGYMADGTMVVVDNASGDIGKIVGIEIVRNIQTAAGRMLFAKKIDASTNAKKSMLRKSTAATKPAAPQRRNNKKRTTTPEDSLISLVENQ